MITSSKIDDEKYLQLLSDLLNEKKMIQVRVEGLSMFPFLLPKDVVRVQPVENRLLTVGRVVLFQGKTGWVAHRLLRADFKNNYFVTRGDANLHRDKPLTLEEIKGVVCEATTYKIFWSNYFVKKRSLLARVSFITAPIFWAGAKTALLFWKAIKKRVK